MTERQETKEKKCTKCGSENVAYQGTSHALYIGERISKVKKHQFRCEQEGCGNIFWYVAEQP